MFFSFCILVDMPMGGLEPPPGYATVPDYVGCFSCEQGWSRGHKAQCQGHKKIRGQGQLFRGQTLSRPRTWLLEEAKDQGHTCKCSPNKKEKKRSSKKFFRQSAIHRRSQNFWLGGGLKLQIICNEWPHQKFSKEELFVGQRYCWMEDLKPLLVGT